MVKNAYSLWHVLLCEKIKAKSAQKILTLIWLNRASFNDLCGCRLPSTKFVMQLLPRWNYFSTKIYSYFSA